MERETATGNGDAHTFGRVHKKSGVDHTALSLLASQDLEGNFFSRGCTKQTMY